MSRHKKYTKKDSRAIIDANEEALMEAEKNEERLKKLNIEVLELDRKIFIENAVKLNDILEHHRKSKAKAKDKDAEIIARGKNILQSLVYLILNNIFYAEIKRIRKQLLIPDDGFNSESEYNDWALQYGKKYHSDKKILYLLSCGYEEVNDEAENIIRKYKLCYAKDIMFLAPIISRFISRKLKFDKFLSIMLPIIYENALNCRVGGEMCDRFQKGFEIKVTELEDSASNFFTNKWSYNLFPFTKLTGIGEMFRDFFEREFYCEKDIKDFDKNYLELLKKKWDVNKNRGRLKQKERLEVVDNHDYITLTFTTNFFTKPSDVIKLYKDKKYKIIKILKLKENKFKNEQKKKLSEKFRRNFELWELKSKGFSHDHISGFMYDKGNDLGDSYTNMLKGEIGEFNSSIRDALRHKIIF